jgi:hypothetical protein
MVQIEKGSYIPLAMSEEGYFSCCSHSATQPTHNSSFLFSDQLQAREGQPVPSSEGRIAWHLLHQRIPWGCRCVPWEGSNPIVLW